MSQRLKLLIVDDERPAREKVARLVAEDARFVVVGQAADGIQALKQLEQLTPDVVILDITMPAIGGFEVLRAWGEPRQFDVIFSTASDAHAVLAFEENAIDYLLKPYDGARMRRALGRVYERRIQGGLGPAWGELLSSPGAGRAQRIVVRTEEGWIGIEQTKISRVSAADKYVSLRVDGQSHIVRSSLKALEQRLDPSAFVRVHRSEIVQVHAVQALSPFGHGDGLLLMKDGESVILSRTYRQQFLALFGERPGS